MFLDVFLHFVECLKFFEVCKGLRATAKLIIDLELPANIWEILKGLKMRQIFARIFLRLLCDEKGQIQVVQSQRSVVELIDISKERNVFGSLVCEGIPGCL